MRKTLAGWYWACVAALLLGITNAAQAVGVADADITGLMDDVQATFDALKTPGLIILGFMLLIPIIKKVVKKFV